MNKITLTADEINDLADFAGLQCTRPDDIEPDTEIDVYPCPADGVRNEGEPSHPGSISHYRFVAVMTDYPDEGCIGLGGELREPVKWPVSPEEGALRLLVAGGHVSQARVDEALNIVRQAA